MPKTLDRRELARVLDVSVAHLANLSSYDAGPEPLPGRTDRRITYSPDAISEWVAGRGKRFAGAWTKYLAGQK